MPAKASTRPNLIPVSDEEAIRIVRTAEAAIDGYKGDVNVLESAIGMHLIGRHVGWKVLLLIHDKRTLRKYEEIVGIDIRKEFELVGHLAPRSRAWHLVQKVTNFWKAVSGEIPGIRSPDIAR